MASSDDFKALLKAGNITEALALALSEAVELKFTTWVPSEEDVETSQAKPGHRLQTRINMIEGEVEHEIGEEFIGNGRYRDLKQIHLDQVAQGSKLIQNNLKSLQKLIEVLVAVRSPGTKTPVFKPESLDTQSQYLPPANQVADTGLAVAPHEGTVTAEVVSPEIITQDDIPTADLFVEPAKAAAADLLVSPDSVTTDIAQAPLPLAEQPASSLSTSADTDSVLDEETEEEEEDDWDNSVLDLLESLPVEPPPHPETSDSDLRETLKWQELVEEESTSEQQESDVAAHQVWENLREEDVESPPLIEPDNLEETKAPVSEDLRDLVEEESSSEPVGSESLNEGDWELIQAAEPQNFEENFEQTTPHVSEDLRDLVEEESNSGPEESAFPENQNWENFSLEDAQLPLTTQENDLQDITSQIDEEDWGDLVENEPQSSIAQPIPNLDSLNLEEDEEWDDWVMEEPEPLLEAPVVDMDALDLGEDDDWGDLVEDADPNAWVPNFDKSPSNLENTEDWDEFTEEELAPSPPGLEINGDTDADFDLFGALDDLTPLESEPSTDPGSVENLPRAGDSTVSEESVPGVSHQDSDSLMGLEEDKDALPKSSGKRVPPPPPPSRSQHQNS